MDGVQAGSLRVTIQNDRGKSNMPKTKKALEHKELVIMKLKNEKVQLASDISKVTEERNVLKVRKEELEKEVEKIRKQIEKLTETKRDDHKTTHKHRSGKNRREDRPKY